MPFVNGFMITNGAVQATTVLPVPGRFHGAKLYNDLDEVYVSTAAPVGFIYNAPYRFAPDGAMYVSSSPPAYYQGGLPFTADGALCYSSPPATDYVSGWPINAGGIVIAGVAPVPIFFAPLQTTLVPTTAGNPTFTFTRTTTAFVTDFEPILRQAISGEARFHGARRVRNWSTFSQALDNAGWGLTQVSVTPGVTGPTGLADAFTITALVTGTCNIAKLAAGLPVGSMSCSSWWVRRRTGTGTVRIRSQDNLTETNITAQLDGTWRRFATQVTATGAAPWVVLTLSIAGDQVDATYVQTEDVTGQANQAPAEYVSTNVLSAPFHGNGINGVKYFATTNGNSVAANVVTEAPGTPIAAATMQGYLLEVGATNICQQSQTFDNASWVKTNATVTANTQAAPDGTTTADTIAATGANGLCSQSVTVTAVPFTLTFYLKRLVGTGQVAISVDGITFVDVTAQINSSTWSRVTTTLTPAAGTVNPSIRLAVSGDSVYVWGAQLESGNFETSYVPTTTASVTRNADSLAYPWVSNIDAVVGSAYVEWFPTKKPRQYLQTLQFALNTATGYFMLGSHAQAFTLTAQSPSGNLQTVNTYNVGVQNKSATGWSGTTMSGSLNGGAIATMVASYGGILNSGNFEIRYIMDPVRNLKFYATRLTNAELQAMTA